MTRTCKVGVHGRNAEHFEEADYQIIREAKIETIKMMTVTHAHVFQRLKAENPNLEIITRLHHSDCNTGGHPTPEKFVADMAPIIGQLQPYCTQFQVLNEPNHCHCYEGWGHTDDHARDFNTWFLDVYTRLKQAHPWASFGFPGLAVPDPLHRDKAWLQICRPAIERADWLGCHCYWQSPPNGGSVMMADHSGLCFKYYHEFFPNKLIHILECGNSNGQGQGFSTDQALYAGEYQQWLTEVFKYPYIASTAFFILSSPDPVWDSFAWRTNGSVKQSIVGGIGNMARPQLVAPQLGQPATNGASAQPAAALQTFAPGDKARALTVMNIRRTPGYSNKDASGSLADVVGATQVSEVLTLLEGPVQADGLDYYRIDRGWVASLAPGGERLLQKVSGVRFRLPFQTPQPRTQGFGERPEFYAQFGLKAHQGIDWGCPVGTPIVAVADGTVAKAENDPAGFGLHVKIDHAFGNTTYAHLCEIRASVGQPVIQGQVIGLSGNTGISSGPHLHFHVRVAPWDDQNGYFGCTDPELYLDSDAVVRADAAPQVAAPQPVAAPQLPSAKVGDIPSVFTYQNLLDAFYNVAGQLGLGNWDVLTKAGLDVAQLAQNRQAVYQGLALAALPNLSPVERAMVAVELVGQMRKAKKTTGTVNSPEGVNLRNGPASDQAILQLLQHQAKLDVMHEEGDWLFVATTEGNAGHVHRNYVARADGAAQPAAAPQPVAQPASVPAPQPTAAGVGQALPGFLAAMPDLLSAPLAGDQIVLGPNAGPGAKLLSHIWNRYGGLLNALAAKLGVDPAVMVAILAVESGGNAFGPDGRTIIRFENHRFYHYWGKQNPDRFAQHFTYNSDRSWEGHTWRADPNQPFQEFHGNQAAEWAVLTFAASLDDTAAKFSISMGLPQIMGSNHQRIGYANVQTMFNAFQADERKHVLGLFDFIKADANMLQAVRNNDYTAFASGYNGPGQAAHYGGLIQKWVQSFGVLRQDPASASFAIGGESTLPDDLDAAISFLPMPIGSALFAQAQPAISTPAPAATVAPATTTAPAATPAVATEAAAVASQPAPVMDERLYNLWLDHIKHGFENNNIMFNRVLRAFMVPYYMTIAMYVIMFAVGIGLFVVAARLSSQQGTQLAGLFFGGLGIASFLGYFMSKPLRSLEENLQFITWLGIVYNSYWTRLLYMQNNTTIQADLKEATAEAVTQIEHILNKNVEVAYKRPDVKEEKQG